jgi:hypothetical protein
MSRKTTSMRGEVVDFDLFAIKEQISGGPITETIQNRERFIDLKRRRGTKRKLQDMLAEQEASQLSVEKALATKSNAAQDAPAAEEVAAASVPTRKIVKKES